MNLTEFVNFKKKEATEIALVNHKGKEIEIYGNYLLDFFDIDKCREIDLRSESDSFVKSRRDECIRQFKGSKKVHSPSFSGAIQAFNEILIYDELKNRSGVIGRHGKGPDYIISKSDKFELNADLKTILFNDADQNLVDYQRQKAISENELFNAKKGIFPKNNNFSPIITSPFLKYKGEIPERRRIIIESLINKSSNQEDNVQLTYDRKNGIQLIDTLLLGFPYFPQDGLREYLYPPVSEFPYRTNFSGCLWHTCFGQPGDKIVDFTGEDRLTKAGILTLNSQYQKAVIFIVRLGGGRSGKPIFCGFYKSNQVERDILECMYEICDFINDEKDSNPFSISNDPLDNYKPFILPTRNE